MNTSLPISSLRLSNLVERQADAPRIKAVVEVSAAPRSAQGKSTLQRFFTALTRSLCALSA